VTAVLALLDQRDHFVSNDGVKQQLSKHLQFRRIEDAPISLHVIATDVLTGAERRISKGDAEAAVLASAAIPGVYPAIEFEGAYLIDGGVCDNTPISAAAELGATVIYVLPTGHSCALSSSPRGAIPMIIHAVSLLTNQRLASDIERFSHQAKLIVLPPPCPIDVAPSDFDHAAELIERGYESAKRALDDRNPADWTPRSLALLRPHAH
jgi:NTE family protein